VQINDGLTVFEDRSDTGAEFDDESLGKGRDRACAADVFAVGAVQLKEGAEPAQDEGGSAAQARHNDYKLL
jgi:hypothetical protein